MGLYAEDYNLVEGSGELNFMVGRLPASVFADWVANAAPSDRYFDTAKGHTGWLVGLSLGKASAPGAWAQMKHLNAVSRRVGAPTRALSLIGADGLARFEGRLLSTLTSLVAFWNLVALPPHEISNNHKGL